MTVETLSEAGRARLLAFLDSAVPKTVRALAENERSVTFDDDERSAAAALYEDDVGGPGPECVHALDPRPSSAAPAAKGSSRDARFWRHLVPTGVSWNRTGFSLAVSYGRFDVTGWCDSPGALCVWNLRRRNVDPRTPDHTFETDSCLQCVAWHPADPAVVAAGSFDGDVHVWDVRGDGDGYGYGYGDGDKDENGDGDGWDTRRGRAGPGEGFVARSAVSHASHREPVTAVAWLPSARAAGTRARRASPPAARTHDVCSFGSDGRVLVWDFSEAETRGDESVGVESGKRASGTKVRRVPLPSFGFEARPPPGAPAARGIGVARGIGAASFVPSGAHGSGEDAAERGRDAASIASSSAFLLGCDTGAVMECLLRRGAADKEAFARETAERAARGEATRAARSPAAAEYEPHRGAVHGVCAHPSEPGVFLSCGADGALKIYSRLERRCVVRLEPRAGALFCAARSPARPALAACGTSGGTVVLYDLTEGGSLAGDDGLSGSGQKERTGVIERLGGGMASLAPTRELRGCRLGTPTQALAFNPALPEYLAAADGTAVRVWDLGARFAVPAPREGAAIRRLAAGWEARG